MIRVARSALLALLACLACLEPLAAQAPAVIDAAPVTAARHTLDLVLIVDLRFLFIAARGPPATAH